MSLERGIARFLYGSKGRGPIGKPVRIFAGVVGLLLLGLSVEGFFEHDIGAAVAGLIVAALGSLLVMLALHAGPAPPGSRQIELAKYRRAQRAQWLCLSIGFVGLSAMKLAGSLNVRWFVRWLPPESHLLSIIFSFFWIAGFICSVFASFYFAQAKDLKDTEGGAA